MPVHFRSTSVTEPFAFNSVGTNWLQGNTSRPEGYPLYHYLQTEEGTGVIHIEGATYTLEPGEGILIAPYIRHSYFSNEKNWFTCFATFTGTLEGSLNKIIGNQSMIRTSKEQGAIIYPLLCKIMKKYETTPFDTKALSLDCYHMLLSFTPGFHSQQQSTSPLYICYVEPVIQEIEKKYNEPLTVENLSHLVYITPQYLSRLFNRFLNCSTYEYLMSHRITKAKEYLLTDHHREISEIATTVGFTDASHFIATFKKITGMTPKAFRKLN